MNMQGNHILLVAQQALAEIRLTDIGSYGSGFAILVNSEIIIFTCKHVICRNQMEEKRCVVSCGNACKSVSEPEHIYISIQNNESYRISNIIVSPANDIAALVLGKNSGIGISLPKGIRVCRSEHLEIYQKICFKGFPMALQSDAFKDHLAHGHIADVRSNNCRFEIECTNHALKIEDLSGMSGSGILLNQGKELMLCGVVGEFNKLNRFSCYGLSDFIQNELPDLIDHCTSPIGAGGVRDDDSDQNILKILRDQLREKGEVLQKIEERRPLSFNPDRLNEQERKIKSEIAEIKRKITTIEKKSNLRP